MALHSQTSGRPGRNEPCHCGSGKKYKHCCLRKDEAKASAARKKAASKQSADAAEAAESGEAASAAAAPVPRQQTEQPWKAMTARGFVPRSRTPRKVGGG
jgi:hypothetical protein